MQLPCKFIIRKHADGKSTHTCFVVDQNIPENVQLEFCGQHDYKKKNQPITEVLFDKCEISKVPQGLSKTFPNITSLSIWYSNLRIVDKSDLIEYRHLEKVSFCNNEIEFLAGDLFEGFKNLENIAFNGNKLKIIEPTILDGLDSLKVVNFSGNLNFTKFFSVYPKYQPNATLEEVKNELFEKFYQNYQSVKNLIRNFQDGIQKLKVANEKLAMQNQLLNDDNEALNETNRKLRSFDAMLIEQNQNIKKKNLIIDLKTEKPSITSKIQSNVHFDLKAFIQQDEAFKDFTITIDDREFPVHKFLLAARSPTLAEILRNNPAVENLNLVDISVEIFEKILKFLYTDELPREDGTNFLHLFAAAGKLKIEELKNYAAVKLVDHINTENAFEILSLSKKYDHEGLRQGALNEMRNKYPEVKLMD